MTEHEFYIYVGNRLKELREQKGLKQKDLADQVGLQAQFISNVENSGKRISAFQLNNLLSVMGYTLDDLMEKDEFKKKDLARFVLGTNGVNGQTKQSRLQAVKQLLQAFFSEEIMLEVAKDIEEEHLRRHAANQPATQHDHSENPGYEKA